MGLKINIDKTISDFKEKGGETNFLPSLKNILTYVKDDKNINKIEHLAYLLATAKIEADYSLARWESDYLCGETGEPYKDKPCQKALNYYRSTDGKKNYYTLGTDSKGLPYFGRGLVQLTGEANYKKYGKTAVGMVQNIPSRSQAKPSPSLKASKQAKAQAPLSPASQPSKHRAAPEPRTPRGGFLRIATPRPSPGRASATGRACL